MYFLHSFREALDTIDIEVTLEEMKSILKLELSSNKDYGNFTTSGVDISNELQLFLNSPMTYYNANTSDLFLFALGNFFDINIVIFKSNERECWAEDLMKNDGCNRKTVYFVQTQTLSQHIDLVVPICTQGTSSDDAVETTNVLQETEVDDEAQEVKPRMRVSIAEKQIKRIIVVLNVSCLHVFFLWYEIIFWDSFSL